MRCQQVDALRVHNAAIAVCDLVLVAETMTSSWVSPAGAVPLGGVHAVADTPGEAEGVANTATRMARSSARVTTLHAMRLLAVAATALVFVSAPVAAAPPYVATVHGVTRAQLGSSWHIGCPVAPPSLVRIHLAYWDFAGHRHLGDLVVARSATHAVSAAFAALYRDRFPIRSIRPVSAFRGSDDRSMAADNTSGFNCRRAVAAGPVHWSAHAYGVALDVNPVENPYREGGRWLPPVGSGYADRTNVRPGMAVPGGTLITAFAAVGWQWGGRWAVTPDYQHFSATGG